VETNERLDCEIRSNSRGYYLCRRRWDGARGFSPPHVEAAWLPEWRRYAECKSPPTPRRADGWRWGRWLPAPVSRVESRRNRLPLPASSLVPKAVGSEFWSIRIVLAWISLRPWLGPSFFFKD
jgi:hypothetical protein